jgi:hypothetical protein
VPINLGGVYMPSQTAKVFDLDDMTRLEVIAGAELAG